MKKKDKYNCKTYNIFTLSGIGIVLALFAFVTIYVDPVFHYHAPLSGWGYELFDERYQNDGIVKHFAYDAIITGTSMTENFKTSLCDKLFGVKSIKVSFQGGAYKEINANLQTAFKNNKNIKLVIRGLDIDTIDSEWDADYIGVQRDGYVFPTYLTDDNIFNDVNYLWNKTIFTNYTMREIAARKEEPTSFDQYGNWSGSAKYGLNAILENYNRQDKTDNESIFGDIDRERLEKMMEHNILQIIKENADTEFYFFFAPYSICYWDERNNTGSLNYKIDAVKYAIELMQEYPNTRIFLFPENYEVVCNLDNYKDTRHYGEWINDDMLQWMHDGQYEITKDNYEQHIENIREFYNNYDYDSIYE